MACISHRHFLHYPTFQSFRKISRREWYTNFLGILRFLQKKYFAKSAISGIIRKPRCGKLLCMSSYLIFFENFISPSKKLFWQLVVFLKFSDFSRKLLCQCRIIGSSQGKDSGNPPGAGGNARFSLKKKRSKNILIFRHVARCCNTFHFSKNNQSKINIDVQPSEQLVEINFSTPAALP